MQKEPMLGLHGFLGKPEDFCDLKFPQMSAEDIFKKPLLPLWQWAKDFNENLSPFPVGLLGYSLGGRLALHCLCEDEKKYSFAIILAANPGLRTSEERRLRLLNDQKWAKKFLCDPWENLITEWNNQPVLKKAQAPRRNEQDFDREKLSQSLTLFSLGHQEDLRDKINALKLPILWICPEAERANIDGISFMNPYSQMVTIEGSHRFFMENAAMTKKLIVDFTNQLSKG